MKVTSFILGIAILASLFIFFRPSSTIDGDEQVTEEMNNVISNYIQDKYKREDTPSSKTFEVHKVYGTEEIDGIISLYLYTQYGEYEGDELIQGHSYPVRIRLEKSGSSYTVTEYTKPESGYYYPSSIEDMFPKKYARKALKDTGNVHDLSEQMDNKVKDWLAESKK
ncbi:hypothetical protein GCM10007140_02670 [Priestia taiwanensis]|uniref:DUF4468 domain-containing protein n=2 Tax=Priestia taiwanensis TaxID=1347902 RepID=A0A917AJG1_9BACI|nr:hypothetical protein GCM10007140_02670 [Priestia taiwanensis]